MKKSDFARLSADPHAYCIAHFALRELDRVGRRVTFKFDDDSELTFNICYEIAK